MKIVTIFLIALSLSIDAFSLALIYGTQGISKRDKIILAIIVGMYHFIMPLIGLSIGSFLTDKIIIMTISKTTAAPRNVSIGTPLFMSAI